MPPPHTHLKGQSIDDLYVIKDVGNDNHHNVLWECRCICGVHVRKTSNELNARRKTKCIHQNASIEETPVENPTEFVRKWKSGNRPAPIQSVAPEPPPKPAAAPARPAPAPVEAAPQQDAEEDGYVYVYENDRLEMLDGFTPNSYQLDSNTRIEDWVAYYVSIMDEKLKNEFLTKLITKEIAHKFI